MITDVLPALSSAASTAAASLASVVPKPFKKVAAPSKWTVTPRRGHTAMVSGIRSLSQTHEQVIVAWTGAQPEAGVEREDEEISEEDKHELEKMLRNYKLDEEVVVAGEKSLEFVPVWLKPSVAKGHYEGYCKRSESRITKQLVSRRYMTD